MMDNPRRHIGRQQGETIAAGTDGWKKGKRKVVERRAKRGSDAVG